MRTFLCMAMVVLLTPVSGWADVHNAQGEMAGEPTAHSVLLQSRLTALPGPELDSDGDIPGAKGVACFEWSTASDFSNSKRTPWLTADPASDYILRVRLEQLQPGTRYFYRLLFGPDETRHSTGPTREFKTLPDSRTTSGLSFTMGSCQNYAFFMHGANMKGGGAPEHDKQRGFPAYEAMTQLNPDFFIGTGDIVYYDHPYKTAAKTLPELRKKWHEQSRLPRLVNFFGKTPAFWSKDDHDFRYNDADLESDTLPDATTGIHIFREQMPVHLAGDNTSPTYRTHRVHPHVQLWFVEGRDFRSPNAMPDGPNKTLWGVAQREWLQQTLLESDALWKIIISPTPMVGPDRDSKRDNHTNTRGFRHEADSFFTWVNENKVGKVMSFCGDRHWQYHSVHPSGFEEFGCGALNDENAIAGIKPGHKNSTDPEGLIDQRFLYPQPTGGFLHVTVEHTPALLRIAFVDDEGNRLYETTKTHP